MSYANIKKKVNTDLESAANPLLEGSPTKIASVIESQLN